MAGKIDVTYVDVYGIETEVEDFEVVYADGEATVTYEDLTATVEVNLKKKSSGMASSASGSSKPSTPVPKVSTITDVGSATPIA